MSYAPNEFGLGEDLAFQQRYRHVLSSKIAGKLAVSRHPGQLRECPLRSAGNDHKFLLPELQFGKIELVHPVKLVWVE